MSIGLTEAEIEFSNRNSTANITFNRQKSLASWAGKFMIPGEHFAVSITGQCVPMQVWLLQTPHSLF